MTQHEHLPDEPMVPRPRVQQRAHPGWWLWLFVPVLAVGLNWSRITAYLEPALPVPTPQLTEPVDRPAFEPAPPPVAREVVPAAPKTLQECMGAGNVITDQVLRCRYGDRPRPAREEREAQGMVSAEYMAQYKAGQEERPVRRAVSVGVESHQILGWDGKKSYRAVWDVSDNQIDHGSVCRNLRSGSVEYRECRKGAKQWFKEQCRVERNPALRERYCSAGSGFSPMG
jgi:hypothetical protein